MPETRLLSDCQPADVDADEGLTAELAAFACGPAPAEWTQADLLRAKLCVLDVIGVTVAGSGEPLSRIVQEHLREDGGRPNSVVIGTEISGTAAQAAYANGVAAHALDYDDVNLAIPGHPSAVIFPALLAAAGAGEVTGRAFLEAFMTGYETACRIGALLGQQHYADGFHATATVGRFGAAAACSRLAGLTSGQTRHAFGMAGTMAAGLKSVFGSDSKPLHAGLAARDGYEAVRLAGRGVTSNPSMLESKGGFAAAHGLTIGTEAPRVHIRANLFKHHASCYNTHAAIEAARLVRADGAFDPRSVEAVEVTVAAGLDSVCNIQTPKTGSEGKFSLRFTVTAALLGLDTSDTGTFTAQIVARADVTDLLPRIRVVLEPGMSTTYATVAVRMTDGSRKTASHDAGIPQAASAELEARLSDKMRALCVPVLGAARTDALREAVLALEHARSLRGLMEGLQVT